MVGRIEREGLFQMESLMLVRDVIIVEGREKSFQVDVSRRTKHKYYVY